MKLLCYIFLFLFACTRIHAGHGQYVFNRISAKEGLASNFVYTIFQDAKGFMWFGTANGLQRYDGKKIIQFRPPPGQSGYLPPVSISQMLSDRKGNIWVRTGKEVGIFDPATFRFKKAKIVLPKPVDPRADFHLWQDRLGRLFLVITKFGVLVYEPATNSFLKSNHPLQNLPKDWTPNVIAEDEINHQYWIGCDSGLVMIDQRNGKVLSRKDPISIQGKLATVLGAADPVTVLFHDSSHRLWINRWITKTKSDQSSVYSLDEHRFLRDTSGLRQPGEQFSEWRGLQQHSDGTLWAFGKMLLSSFDAQAKGFQYIRHDHVDDYGIRYDQVYTIFEDKEKNLWIGTDQGVYAVNPNNQFFRAVHPEIAGAHPEISANGFLETKNREVFVSTWGKGLLCFANDQWDKAERIDLPATAADTNFGMQWCIYNQQNSASLFVGCQSGRLLIHNLHSRKTRYLNPGIFQEKTVRQIIGDRKGNIWFATQYGHIVKWNALTGNSNNIEKELRLVNNLQTIVYKLFEDADGWIWAGTHEHGLIKIDPVSGNIVERYTSTGNPARAISSNIVTDISQIGDSGIVVAAGALNFINLRTGVVRQVSATEGLPSNTVSSIQPDGHGSLWIGMLSGLCRYDIAKQQFTSFSQRNGILRDNFQPGARYQLTDGRLLFGNTHDFIVFQPTEILSEKTPPDVTLTGFKLFNDYLPPDSVSKLKEIRLEHTQNSITFEFASLSFLQNDNIAYYYKLEGIDRDWNKSERSLFANYTQLPPGEYRFMVWCESASGGRSQGITTLHITVIPPFWKTGWFFALVLISGCALVYLAHRIRVNRIMAMEAVRRRIARDLHDDMGSTLSTINILSEMARMKVSTDSDKTREFIEKISDNSSRMMDAMDDIVWSINPMNDSMLKVSARMREFATGVLEAKNIDFNFRVDDAVHELRLNMEARHDFFLLFKEAVNNMAKYSECSMADIEIKVEKSFLRMKISDNGIGFRMNENSGGNGLNNMRKRAQSLRGNLVIDSLPHRGTSVWLEAPLN